MRVKRGYRLPRKDNIFVTLIREDEFTLFQKFYDHIKDKYPEYSYNQIVEICRAPFILAKDNLDNGLMKKIRIPNVGAFTPSVYYMEALMKQKMYRQRRGHFSQYKLKKLKRNLKKKIKEIKNAKRTRQKIRKWWV